jgi:hypothetical protein
MIRTLKYIKNIPLIRRNISFIKNKEDQIYYSRNLCFKITGLTDPIKAKQYEEHINNIKIEYPFWTYDRIQKIIVVNNNSSCLHENIIKQLTMMATWLFSNQCSITGSFCYRTKAYIGMIYFVREINLMNHIVISDEMNDLDTVKDLDMLINSSEYKIRKYIGQINIDTIPMHYIK